MHVFPQSAASSTFSTSPVVDGAASIKAAVNDIQEDLTTLSRLSLEAARRNAVKVVVPELIRLGLTIGTSLLGGVGVVFLVFAAAWTLAPNVISATAWTGGVLVMLAILAPTLLYLVQGKKGATAA